MARKILTEKEKKKRRKKRIFLVFFLLILLGVGGYFGYRFIDKKLHPPVVEKKEKDNTKIKDFDYGYMVYDMDSKYYQEEFKKLKEILMADEVDTKAYAEQEAKLFVIDLYTMSTKINKYDIGGNEFFHVDRREMYEKKVMDTLYSSMLDNTYGDRKQELPEVKNVTTVSVSEIDYTLDTNAKDENDKSKINDVPGYLVKLKIEYVKTMGYDTEASVIIIQENGGKKWSVVDYKPTLNPKY